MRGLSRRERPRNFDILLDVRQPIALVLDRTSIASLRNSASRETIALR
jgi:hypothetical protein